MSFLARPRRRAVAAVAGVAVILGGCLAAAALAARVPEVIVPRLTFTPGATPVADVTVGSTVTYTVAVRNTGKVVTGMSVADTLPDGVALIAAEADADGSCSGAMPRITCTWDSVATGLTVNAAFVVQVIVPGTLTNGMQLTPSDSDNTIVTAGALPPPIEAGEGVAIRFAPKPTLTPLASK